MSKIEVYYKNLEGSLSKLTPCPLISINPEFYYANDSVIGYTYSISLNGYAAALESQYDSFGSGTASLDLVINSIDYIKKVFNNNGGSLEVYAVDDNSTKKILAAKGALIKNIEFSSSENYWINYAPYSVEIEFNEVDFIGCSGYPEIVCGSGIFDQKSYPNNLVDINKYKIKEFNDQWSFSLDDNLHNDYDNAFFNSTIQVEYTISAVGKNYYVTNNSGKILPAWEQAKNFVQDRLYTQLYNNLRGSLRLANSTDSCAPDKTLTLLHSGILDEGLMSSIAFDSGNNIEENENGGYKIYNEIISCDTSESKGSFSASYSAILKRYNPSLPNHEQNNSVLHTYTKNITVNNDQQYNHNISIEGSIRGLIGGSLLDRPGGGYSNSDRYLELPKTGKFLTAKFDKNSKTKYEYAKGFFYDRIGTDSDLYDSMKDKYGVSYFELGIRERPKLQNGSLIPPAEGGPPYPACSNFSLNHDYSNGTINYSAEYNSNTAVHLERGYSSVSIVRNDPVYMTQEFVIPGRAEGPIIQNLFMKTAKTISININGAHPNNKSCVDNLSNEFICSFIPAYEIENINSIINNDNENWVRTKKDFTTNPIDGSFSISLEYTCTQP